MKAQRELQHLLWRAGFGAKPTQIKSFSQPESKWVDQLFESSKNYDALQVTKEEAPRLQEIRMMSKEERKKLMQDARQQIKDLNLAWLDHMVQTPAQLRERMTLFWHGHFACQPKNIFHAQLQINTLRTHALGKFEDLLLAVAQDPAMLQYLNNQQNRKQKPNENFARELMELFTLGRGHYTEQDIKASARAFTGWGFNGNDFVFRERLHDFGEKEFFGKTGNFNGEDIIRLILEKPQTALFITEKIYRYFVGDIIHPERIQKLSQYFYDSGYDIERLMREIFTSEWFYAPENIGSKIKSPVELLVGLRRQLGIEFQNPQAQLFIQKALGQMLLNPPNVAGWPQGKAWIDSSSLLLRLKIPQAMYLASEVDFELKDRGDAQQMEPEIRKLRKMQVSIDWQSLLTNLTRSEILEENFQNLATYLLQNDVSKLEKEIVAAVRSQTNLEPIQHLCILLCSLPEYQVC